MRIKLTFTGQPDALAELPGVAFHHHDSFRMVVGNLEVTWITETDDPVKASRMVMDDVDLMALWVRGCDVQIEALPCSDVEHVGVEL